MTASLVLPACAFLLSLEFGSKQPLIQIRFRKKHDAFCSLAFGTTRTSASNQRLNCCVTFVEVVMYMHCILIFISSTDRTSVF